MLREFSSIHYAAWYKLGLYTVLTAAVYFSTFRWLVSNDWVKGDYNYCYIIPFLILYLLWEKRNDLLSAPSRLSWKGFVPVAVGLLFFWAGELGGEFFTLYMSFWLIIIGLAWTHFGWEKIKIMSVALILIMAMFPLPDVFNVKLSFGLKLISSWLGVGVLHVYGLSAFREGNVIDLGFTQLQVVDACSGIRYLFPLMILSFLLAYWFRAHIYKRIVLFLSSIPLAIVVNSFRIAMTGILYSAFGAKVAEDFFHGFSGWLIFLAATAFLLFEMYVLRKLPPKEKSEVRGQKSEVGERLHDGRGKKEERGEGGGRNQGSEVRDTNIPIYKQLLEPHFLVAFIVLAVTFTLSHAIEFREKTPIKKPFNGFPLQIEDWQGSRQTMEYKFLKELDLSDYAIIDYKNLQGKEVNFYVAYYESQRKGESIHSPETCLPGSGWTFNEAGAATITLPKSNKVEMKVNRAFMEKAGVRELTYYWLPQRGRILTNLVQSKIYTFWDALTKQRTDGALVRIITPVYKSETLQDAEQRLQGFVRQVVPLLDEYLPGR